MRSRFSLRKDQSKRCVFVNKQQTYLWSNRQKYIVCFHHGDAREHLENLQQSMLSPVHMDRPKQYKFLRQIRMREIWRRRYSHVLSDRKRLQLGHRHDKSRQMPLGAVSSHYVKCTLSASDLGTTTHTNRLTILSMTNM